MIYGPSYISFTYVQSYGFICAYYKGDEKKNQPPFERKSGNKSNILGLKEENESRKAIL